MGKREAIHSALTALEDLERQEQVEVLRALAEALGVAQEVTRVVQVGNPVGVSGPFWQIPQSAIGAEVPLNAWCCGGGTTA